MARADYYYSSPTSSRKCHDLLDLVEGLGFDVEFGAGLEGFGPGVVDVGCGCAEGDRGLRLFYFLSYLVHGRFAFGVGTRARF